MYLGKSRLGHWDRNDYRGTFFDSRTSLGEKLRHRFWIGTLLLMIAVGISMFLLIGYLAALSTPFFKLEQVEIKGNQKVSQTELLQKGGLTQSVNLLSLNLKEVKAKMESLPWVKEVRLRRELPNRLQVTVIEHQPFLLTTVGEHLYFLDREGVLFKKLDLKGDTSLPLLTGLGPKDGIIEGRLRPQLLAEVKTLLDLLSRGKDPFYPHKLSEIHYDPDCGYTLYTIDRGIRISLGKEDFPIKVKRLEKIWAALETRPDITALKGISLQYGRKIIVHGLHPGTAAKKTG
jgi:cell division protein FtsQ